MQENEYTDDFVAKLELLWGEGFLSPGGPAETARILEELRGLLSQRKYIQNAVRDITEALSCLTSA